MLLLLHLQHRLSLLHVVLRLLHVLQHVADHLALPEHQQRHLLHQLQVLLDRRLQLRNALRLVQVVRVRVLQPVRRLPHHLPAHRLRKALLLLGDPLPFLLGDLGQHQPDALEGGFEGEALDQLLDEEGLLEDGVDLFGEVLPAVDLGEGLGLLGAVGAVLLDDLVGGEQLLAHLGDQLVVVVAALLELGAELCVGRQLPFSLSCLALAISRSLRRRMSRLLAATLSCSSFTCRTSCSNSSPAASRSDCRDSRSEASSPVSMSCLATPVP